MSVIFSLVCFAVFAQPSRVFENKVISSKILGEDRKYAIYLPEGYDQSDRSYPVLYLLHGAGDDHTGWVQYGEIQYAVDKSVADGRATQMIVVMPDGNTTRRGYFNDVKGDYKFEDFFFEELIPHIDKTYRTRTARRYRAIAGLSMGGGGTLVYAMHHPDTFAAACPLSAAVGPLTFEEYKVANNQPYFKGNIAGATDKDFEAHFKRHNYEQYISSLSADELGKIKNIRWYITCGDDDFLFEGNANLHVFFRKNMIPHEFRVLDGAHTWSYWRAEIYPILDFVSKSFTQK